MIDAEVEVTRDVIGDIAPQIFGGRWGSHEPGHCAPEHYAARLREFADAIWAEEPTIKTIAPGVFVEPGTSAEWNDIVLRDAADVIDALSLHWYFPGPLGRARTRDEAELRQIMTAGDTLGPLLDATIAGIDRIACTDRALSVVIGEWGFWPMSKSTSVPVTGSVTGHSSPDACTASSSAPTGSPRRTTRNSSTCWDRYRPMASDSS